MSWGQEKQYCLPAGVVHPEGMTESFAILASTRARQLSKTNPRYSRVFFGARLRFDLTLTETVLCDIVQVLSRKTGWCFASRAYHARLLGTSERTIRRSVSKLIKLKLLERHEKDPRQLRTTMLWISECQADDVAGP